MLASFPFAALTAALALFSEVVVAQSDVCKSAPYNALTCLSTVKEAKSACKEVPRQTKTVTVTTTTLDILTRSITQSAASQNQITAESTQTEYRTVTVTKGPTSTYTDLQLSTYSANATITTYVPCSVISQAALVAAAETCNAANALPALASLTSNDTLATACSCMGNPVPTITTTETVEAPAVDATTTAIEGTPKTTTLYAITVATVTETVAPVTTVSASSSTTLTSTSTVSLEAPTFTPVFGPKAGCANINRSGTSEPLSDKITTLPAAVKKCKALCEQEPSCKSVYVQKMFEMWEERRPHFMCTMGTKKLKPRRDLRCGKKESVFGLARGFDAGGRGKAEAKA